MSQRRRLSRASEMNIDILDANASRSRLEHIPDEAQVDEGSLEAVNIFLDAWDRARRGGDHN
jgi:hypothetical protein